MVKCFEFFADVEKAANFFVINSGVIKEKGSTCTGDYLESLKFFRRKNRPVGEN